MENGWMDGGNIQATHKSLYSAVAFRIRKLFLDNL